MLILLKTILFSEPVSWIVQLLAFYVLARWSGIHWEWAFLLLVGLELIQLDFNIIAINYIAILHPDLVMDLIFGSIGIYLGCHDKHKQSSNMEARHEKRKTKS